MHQHRANAHRIDRKKHSTVNEACYTCQWLKVLLIIHTYIKLFVMHIRDSLVGGWMDGCFMNTYLHLGLCMCEEVAKVN